MSSLCGSGIGSVLVKDRAIERRGRRGGVVDTYRGWARHGTERVDDSAIEDAVVKVLDPTPGGVIEQLDLVHPMFEPTSYHGYFGRQPDGAGP